MWRRERFPWQRQEAREERPGAEWEGREREGSAREEHGGARRRPEGQGWGQRRDGELGLGFGAAAEQGGRARMDGTVTPTFHQPGINTAGAAGNSDSKCHHPASWLPTSRASQARIPPSRRFLENSSLEDKIWFPIVFFPPWKQVTPHWPTGKSRLPSLEHPSGQERGGFHSDLVPASEQKARCGGDAEAKEPRGRWGTPRGTSTHLPCTFLSSAQGPFSVKC